MVAVNSVERRPSPLFRAELRIGVTMPISTVSFTPLEVPEPPSGNHFAETRGRRGHFPALQSSARAALGRPVKPLRSTASAPSSPCLPPRKTVPAYMLSARPGPASPQTIRTPFCIMNPAIGPTLPATISIPPFIAMPARVDASPLTTTVPARIEAATALPALPSITTVPSRMLSAGPPACSAMHDDTSRRRSSPRRSSRRSLRSSARCPPGGQRPGCGERRASSRIDLQPAAIADRIAWLIARTGQCPPQSEMRFDQRSVLDRCEIGTRLDVINRGHAAPPDRIKDGRAGGRLDRCVIAAEAPGAGRSPRSPRRQSRRSRPASAA